MANQAATPAAMTLALAPSTLLLGGQKSGKSASAENLAAAWLAHDTRHRAVLLACARNDSKDREMQSRIDAHRQARQVRVPGLMTLEEPLAVAAAIDKHAQADTMVIIDCLSTWLTNQLFPVDARQQHDMAQVHAAHLALHQAIEGAHARAAPLVLISHEVGLGLVPLGAEVRQFVDTLGSLNQAVAAQCAQVLLMVAGLPLVLKSAHCRTDRLEPSGDAACQPQNA